MPQPLLPAGVSAAVRTQQPTEGLSNHMRSLSIRPTDESEANQEAAQNIRRALSLKKIRRPRRARSEPAERYYHDPDVPEEPVAQGGPDNEDTSDRTAVEPDAPGSPRKQQKKSRSRERSCYTKANPHGQGIGGRPASSMHASVPPGDYDAARELARNAPDIGIKIKPDTPMVPFVAMPQPARRLLVGPATVEPETAHPPPDGTVPLTQETQLPPAAWQAASRRTRTPKSPQWQQPQ